MGRVLEKKFGTGRVPGSRQTLVSRCRPADRQCDDGERGKIVLCDKIAQFALLSRAGAANTDNGMLSYLSGPPAERVAIRGVEDEGDLAF